MRDRSSPLGSSTYSGFSNILSLQEKRSNTISDELGGIREKKKMLFPVFEPDQPKDFFFFSGILGRQGLTQGT
jgi:hypothetical protein